MKKQCTIFIFAMTSLIALAVARPAFGATRYVAQTAGIFSGGTACNGQTAITPATFNGLTNSPGDVNYVCGTITGSAGSTLLSPNGNGSSGNPVQIIFDTGAILQAPYFAGPPNGGCGGAICLYNKSYYTVDGGTNGIIQNTANGTTLSYKQTTEAIEGMNCSNCTVKNLTISNMYVHTSTSDDTEDQTGIRCITLTGSNWTISNNIMHDAGWCLFQPYNSGDTNTNIYNNEIYNIDHGWILATQSAGGNSGPFNFNNNHVHDYSNWDTTSNSYHHDGIHCYTSTGSGGSAHFSALNIYNNTFDGSTGVNITAHIFNEGGSGSGSTPCSDGSSVINIYNNLLSANSPINNGLIAANTGVENVYNNTFIGSGTGSGVGFYIQGGQSDTVVFKNNALTGFNQIINIPSGVNFTADYNEYGNGGSNAFVCHGNFYDPSTISSWKSCIGGEGNSGYSASLTLSSSGIPLTGSVLINAGTNLSSLCSQSSTALLCSDRVGNPRPGSGAWTVGAFVANSSTGPLPPTNLTGNVTAK